MACQQGKEKKEDQEEIGLEDVLRLLKMELHCNARRIGYKNMQFSNLFCSVPILGAFSSLAKILVILFILTFYDVILKLCCEFFSYLNTCPKPSGHDKAFTSWNSHVWEWFHPYEILWCVSKIALIIAVLLAGSTKGMSEFLDMKWSLKKWKGVCVKRIQSTVFAFLVATLLWIEFCQAVGLVPFASIKLTCNTPQHCFCGWQGFYCFIFSYVLCILFLLSFTS